VAEPRAQAAFRPAAMVLVIEVVPLLVIEVVPLLVIEVVPLLVIEVVLLLVIEVVLWIIALVNQSSVSRCSSAASRTPYTGATIAFLASDRPDGSGADDPMATYHPRRAGVAGDFTAGSFTAGSFTAGSRALRFSVWPDPGWNRGPAESYLTHVAS
jgi:hypothetical protein